MFGKQKLKAEIVRLTYRVEELEERLCPCEQHEWKRIGYDFKIGCGAGDIETIYTYKCKRCGKHFDLEVRESRSYSTKRSLCDMPEDFDGEEE